MFVKACSDVLQNQPTHTNYIFLPPLDYLCRAKEEGKKKAVSSVRG